MHQKVVEEPVNLSGVLDQKLPAMGLDLLSALPLLRMRLLGREICDLGENAASDLPEN